MKIGKLILYGLAILVFILIARAYNPKPFVEAELVKLTVTANERIKTTSGRYTYYGYSFQTNEFQAKFTIDNCINFVCDENDIKKIQPGDKLEVMVENNYQEHLADIKSKISIFSLTINNKLLFSPETFLLGRKKQNHRAIALFSILIPAFILLNSKKKKAVIGWILIIACTVLFFILVELEIL